MSHPLLIFGQSDYLIQVVITNSHTKCYIVQSHISWLFLKPTDLDLRCLQKQGISRFSRTRVNFRTSTKYNPPAATDSGMTVHSIKLTEKTTLTVTTFLTNSADDKLVILFLIFSENRIWHFMQNVSDFPQNTCKMCPLETVCMKSENMIWHFMQNVSTGDSLHEMLNPIFWGKKKKT